MASSAVKDEEALTSLLQRESMSSIVSTEVSAEAGTAVRRNVHVDAEVSKLMAMLQDVKQAPEEPEPTVDPAETGGIPDDWAWEAEPAGATLSPNAARLPADAQYRNG